jgi:hypothetical protein
MASLAELPKLIGFFSYSRNDDEGDDGAVLNLANRIYRELRSQLGRNDQNFKLWRDKDALAAGEHWKEKLKEAVSEAAFFIQLVTPSAVNSGFCRFEFDSFLEREKELGRNDLVFPILYISVPDLEAATADDAVISIVKDRQFVDWRPIRHYDVNSREVKQTVEQFCSTVSRKLRLPWLSPEERREAEARRAAEAERRSRQEAEAKQRADEKEGRRKAEAEERQRAEEERRREEAQTKRRLDEAEAEKRRQDKERRELEKEAAWAAKKERLYQWRGAAAAGAAVVALLMVGGIWLYRTTTPTGVYRTTTPTGVTSAVVQPDAPSAEKAKTAAEAEAKRKATKLFTIKANTEAVMRLVLRVTI